MRGRAASKFADCTDKDHMDATNEYMASRAKTLSDPLRPLDPNAPPSAIEDPHMADLHNQTQAFLTVGIPP